MDETRTNREFRPLAVAGVIAARYGLNRLIPAVLPAVILPAVILLAATLLVTVVSTSVFAQQSGGVEISAIKLRKTGTALGLRFISNGPVTYEAVGNLPRRVLVIKFKNARAVFPNDQRQFVYNDPYVVGIAFEQVPNGDLWAKIKLRVATLQYSVKTDPAPHVRLLLKPSDRPPLIELSAVRLGKEGNASRVVIDLSRVAGFNGQMGDSEYTIRLQGVIPRLLRPPRGQDKVVSLKGVEQDGNDTLVRINMRRPDVRVNSFSLAQPPRLVFDFRPPPKGTPPGKPSPLVRPTPGGPAAPRAESLEALLDLEKNPLIRGNYMQAEREYRAGRYKRAQQIFLRVFDSAPGSLLGLRAYFRTADSQYQRKVAEGDNNLHEVIINYQSAIRAAEKAGYDSDQVPRALYQIGRSYQRMGFNFESNVHYQILQEQYPDNYPYTPDSRYYQGLNHITQGQHENAVNAFKKFFDSDGDSGLQGPAHYHLGDAYYNLKRYVEARTEFDQGRKRAPNYTDKRPRMIFHMGETYYENADFQQAREFYQALLDRFPDKSYTKLVGLRQGDFLREEGKEATALKVYQDVVKNAPPVVALRGKLRMAGIYGNRPTGKDYQKGLALYDEVMKEADDRDVVVQEALLRKALTLMLHGHFQESVDHLEKMKLDYPDGPYTRDNMVLANIEENLKSLIDQYFSAGKYWEVAKVHARYSDRYFRDFRFKSTLFQVARAYQQLGLFDESLIIMEDMVKKGAGEMEPLVDYLRARTYLDKDDLNAAENTLLAYLAKYKEGPYLVDAQMLLGEVYFSARRYEDAINAYRIIVQDLEKSRTPELAEAQAEVDYRLGIIYKELGRNQPALGNFRETVANFHHPIQGPSVPEFVIHSHFLVGEMLYELGQDQDSIREYEKAIELYPESPRTPWARYQIGLIYRRGGEEQKALEVFNALVDLAKTKPGEMWESLARQNQRDLANKLQYQEYLKQ